MTWFRDLFGFKEESPAQVRRHLVLEDSQLRSLVNEKSYDCGRLNTPTLEELRAAVEQEADNSNDCITFSEITADAQDLHLDESNNKALFQVASQFNLLEMASPDVSPEEGVGIYELDKTQGPACAIAAGAGTVFRNYYAPVGRQVGQNTAAQIDCLSDLGFALGNENERLWRVVNGYALASSSGLAEISDRLGRMDEKELDFVRSQLRVGIMWETEVTIKNSSNKVSQVYCSAVPVAYSNEPSLSWEPFARLILEATYEATLCAAVLNKTLHGSKTLFLTMVGGGVFGNRQDWIIDAIERALSLYRTHDLDVRMVSYKNPNKDIKPLLREYSSS
ncbi:hypothetical protein N9222_01240 [Pseudomonadales bacterium]|nr:hypothetical protein [Pseudomonadales bacterium]